MMLVPVVLWLGKSKKNPPTVVVVGGSPLHMQCDADRMWEGWRKKRTEKRNSFPSNYNVEKLDMLIKVLRFL